MTNKLERPHFCPIGALSVRILESSFRTTCTSNYKKAKKSKAWGIGNRYCRECPVGEALVQNKDLKPSDVIDDAKIKWICADELQDIQARINGKKAVTPRQLTKIKAANAFAKGVKKLHNDLADTQTPTTETTVMNMTNETKEKVYKDIAKRRAASIGVFNEAKDIIDKCAKVMSPNYKKKLMLYVIDTLVSASTPNTASIVTDKVTVKSSKSTVKSTITTDKVADKVADKPKDNAATTRPPGSHFTIEQLAAIRKRREDGESYSSIAAAFNASSSTIGRVCRREGAYSKF